MHAGTSAQRLSHFLCHTATESDSKRIECQKYFLEVKAAGEYGWQLHQFQNSTLKNSGILSLLKLYGIVTGLYLERFTSLSQVRLFFFKPMVLKIWPYGPREGYTNYLRSQNSFWVDHRIFTAGIKYIKFKTELKFPLTPTIPAVQKISFNSLLIPHLLYLNLVPSG